MCFAGEKGPDKTNGTHEMRSKASQKTSEENSVRARKEVIKKETQSIFSSRTICSFSNSSEQLPRLDRRPWKTALHKEPRDQF